VQNAVSSCEAVFSYGANSFWVEYLFSSSLVGVDDPKRDEVYIHGVEIAWIVIVLVKHLVTLKKFCCGTGVYCLVGVVSVTVKYWWLLAHCITFVLPQAEIH
jgi:hypothetical protein